MVGNAVINECDYFMVKLDFKDFYKCDEVLLILPGQNRHSHLGILSVRGIIEF